MVSSKDAYDGTRRDSGVVRAPVRGSTAHVGTEEAITSKSGLLLEKDSFSK